MTVSSTVTKVTYDGNDSTTEFPYTFKIIDSSDIKVYITSAQNNVTLLNSNFSVDTGSSKVIYPTLPDYPPLSSDEKITIVRLIPLTQDITLRSQSVFNSDVIESEFDKLTYLLQQAQEQIDRCIKYSISSSDNDTDPNTALEQIQNSITSASESADSAAESAIIAAQSASYAMLVYSVKDYGAVGDGVTDDTEAFEACLAAHGSAFCPPGTYIISNLNGENRTIYGSDRRNTFIKGNGDLIVNARYFEMSNISIENITTRGKLISIPTSGDIGRNRFLGVNFGKSTHHFYSQASANVDIYFNTCVFNDASQYSRHIKSAWAYTEDKCYTWFNNIGIRIISGQTISFNNSVFEYNTLQGVILDANIGAINSVSFRSSHFEGNGASGPVNQVLIKTSAALRVRSVNFDTCSFMVLNGSEHVGLSAGGGGNIDKISFNCGFSNGVPCTNASYVTFDNFEINSGTYPSTALYYESLLSQYNSTKTNIGLALSGDMSFIRVNGALAGNNYVQTSNIGMSVGDLHIVYVSTLDAGDTSKYAYQVFAVTREKSGTIRAVAISNNTNGVHCVIGISSEYYTVNNGGSMATTFQPCIRIQKF